MDGPTIVLSILILVSGFTVYAFIKLSHLERISKIEKGIDIGSDSNIKYLGLKIGLLFIGIAIGLIVGFIIGKLANIHDDLIYPSSIFLFGGISLIASYFWVERLQKK